MNHLDFKDEESLIAYLDLANMFHWQEVLKWKFSVKWVIKNLLSLPNIKETRVYYGLNDRELKKSKNFHKMLRENGAIVISKPVKWIQKEIKEDLFVKPRTLAMFDGDSQLKLKEMIDSFRKQKIFIEEPKCNFDVEIALDMLDAVDKISGILLFSGDSDLYEPLKRLKVKGKSIYIFGVRGRVATELWQACTKYIDFGKWYRGEKRYIKSENPR